MMTSIITWFEHACDAASVESSAIWSSDGRCATRGRLAQMRDRDLLDLWKRLRAVLKELRQRALPAAAGTWKFAGGSLHVWEHVDGHIMVVLREPSGDPLHSAELANLGEDFLARPKRRGL